MASAYYDPFSNDMFIDLDNWYNYGPEDFDDSVQWD